MKIKSFSLDQETVEILEKVSKVYGLSQSQTVRYLILEADKNSFLERRKMALREDFAKRNVQIEKIQQMAEERREQRIAQAKTREQEHLEKIKQREARYQAFVKGRK